MKVLMLTVDFPPRTIGGEGIFAAAIAPLLCARGIELEIVAPRAPGDTEHDAALGLPVRRVPVTGNNFVARTLSFAWNTRRLIRSYQGDIVYSLRPVARPRQPLVSHFHTTRAGQARAAWRAGSRIVAFLNALFVPLDIVHARNSARVLGVNEAMRSELSYFNRVPPAFAVLANGVDRALFNASDRSCGTGMRILFVGRLDPLKRIPDLLAACAVLAPDYPQLRLTIVGSGREEARIRAIIRKLRLDDRVQLIARVEHEQMPAIYKAHDILVLPSVYESFGLVALEAMACGTQAVTSDACARLGQRTYASGDVAELTRLLGEFARNPPISEQSRQLSEDVARNASWEDVADRLVAWFACSKRENDALRT